MAGAQGYIKMASRRNFIPRVDKRRADAKLRAEARAKRGDAGQLARLKANGHGHCKEAQRLSNA